MAEILFDVLKGLFCKGVVVETNGELYVLLTVASGASVAFRACEEDVSTVVITAVNRLQKEALNERNGVGGTLHDVSH